MSQRITSLEPEPNSTVHSGDTIVISFSADLLPSSVSSSSILLSYTSYEISLPFDVSIDPSDHKKVIVTIGDTSRIEDRIKIVVVGGDYGVKFEDGDELDRFYYDFYYNLEYYSDDSSDTGDDEEESDDEDISYLKVVSTDPEDSTSNFRGEEVSITFNTQPSTDNILDYVFVYLRPVLKFDGAIDIPDEGFLDSGAFDIEVVDNVLTIRFHDDAIPHNTLVNIILKEGLEAADATYSPLPSQFELVFSMNYSPQIFSASVFSTLFPNVPDELIYRAQLISAGIASNLWSCGSIDWSNLESCVILFIFENTKDILLRRFGGVVAYLGGSFTKQLGDLRISYSSKNPNDNSLLNSLYPLVANCCKKVGIVGGVLGRLNDYPIPYYNKETAGRRFPLLKNYIRKPKKVPGESSPYYGIVVYKDMDLSKHIEEENVETH